MTAQPSSAPLPRIERDALGSQSIEDRCFYGVQTSRALENFSISGTTISHIPHFVACMIRVKQAAALANFRAGALSEEIALAILDAGDHWLAHPDPSQFCVDIYHGGGGTAANMNVNEVLANHANEMLTGRKGYDRVHPNTHVNMAQSTNDVIPSAMRLAVYLQLDALERVVRSLVNTLLNKEIEFSDLIKIARTCLQDALPISLGQEFSGYRGCFDRQLQAISAAKKLCLQLPLGATAVGTGFGAPPAYRSNVFLALQKLTGLEVAPETNLFDAMQNADQWITISAVLKATALSLSKISNDLRLLSSGPRAGLSEIELPAVQPGSSIMPGKINPVIPEMMMQVYFRVLGNDATITRACEGELDLNVWESAILNSVSESITLLCRGIPVFIAKCLDGLKPNAGVCRAHAEASLALATAAAIIHGYPRAISIVRHAETNACSVKQAAVELGVFTEEEASEVFSTAVLTNADEFNRVVRKFRNSGTEHHHPER